MPNHEERLAASGKFGRWHATRKTRKPSSWVAVYDAGNKSFLVGLRSSGVGSPGTWGIPGGGADDGEKAVSAALRELEEETRARLVRKSARVKASDLVFAAASRKASLYVLAVRSGSHVAVRRNRETDRFRWKTAKELKALRPSKRHFSLNFMLANLTAVEKAASKDKQKKAA